jgi:phage-related protein (TIGR01555 family)
MWPRKQKTQPAEVELPQPVGFFTTDLGPMRKHPNISPLALSIQKALPVVEGMTMDSASDLENEVKFGSPYIGVPDAILGWYGSQGFIGYQVCAVMAQHWLVDKACLMPGRDAVRQGYEVNIDGDTDQGDEILKRLKKADKRYGINKQMTEFIHMGRVFGIRVAIFKVDSTDPEYYSKPFNPDGIAPGSYRGIAQVDPIWCIPELTAVAVSQPDSMHFYEPTFWRIGGTRYHRSHLCIYVPHPVADILKPTYMYGGVSTVQRIYERVYAAERTANEAPQLTMTKRLTVLKVNMASFMSNLKTGVDNLLLWCGLRDNYGVKVVDKEAEDVNQFDTALADVDTTIMTQYQLVAAVANVPATKLLGTQPKGFNSTGEYEEATYREELESIQTNDLQPMLDRHHLLVMRSDIAPKLGIEPLELDATWMPLDSPTAQEWATINKTKAETDAILVGAGAIDGMDVRQRLEVDKNSDYFGLAEVEEAPVVEEVPEEAPIDGQA